MDLADRETESRDRSIRKGAAWALALLLPTLIAAGCLALFTQSAARCITYGPCETVASGRVIWYLLVASAVFGTLAVAVPSRLLAVGWVRALLFAAQVITQLMMALAVFDALGVFQPSP
ncbi:hypothetical protein SAMN05428954_0093 [Streptomyces sp. 2112.3]|uniref:hypothetical protein n=1 Tax=Streptomyces sp. 2112.3 TaxID=1881023 RepID=UPI000895F0B0|nr:hypothetical protein [Streptomyces sp. 2112.3]SED32382.1 hypothetical protein SAMN05428954_0093 [Streptomyces sp. 2112.3]